MIISNFLPNFFAACFRPLRLGARSGARSGVAFALACWLALFVTPVSAQSSPDMRNEINRLRNDVADLQRQISAGGRGPTAVSSGRVAPVGNESATSQLKVQVDQMDQELRGMTGQIEQLSFQVNQVNTRLEKLIEDMEFRLTALERGGGAAPLGGTPGNAPVRAPRPQSGLQAPASPMGAVGGAGADVDAGLSELAPPAITSTLEGSRTPPPPPGLAAASPKGSPDEQYAAAFGLLRAGEYSAAAQGMEQFVKDNPDHELAGNAVYWLGETYYVRKDYARAATYFLDGFQKYPQSRKGPDNLLKLGMTLGELNHKAEACQALGQVVKKYPKAPEKITQRAGAEIKRLNC
jgi:tol-pal system protein YbgF